MNNLAVLADIHGNRWALEAVLDDVARRGIRDLVNLGDSFYGPLDPAGTAAILAGLSMPSVRGNEDRIIVEEHPDPPPTLQYVRRCLQEGHLRWLRSLEQTAVLDGLLCFHGSPRSDTEYLLWEVGPNRVALRRAAEVSAFLPTGGHRVVLCGHDHMPRTMTLADGTLVVDPGSVGLPAYSDDLPFPHAMETGTPHGRYSVITETPSGWLVEDVAVPYDWQAAVESALANGRPDWADWLRTGQAWPPA